MARNIPIIPQLSEKSKAAKFSIDIVFDWVQGVVPCMNVHERQQSRPALRLLSSRPIYQPPFIVLIWYATKSKSQDAIVAGADH